MADGQQRVGALDGLRFLAFLLVFFNHAAVIPNEAITYISARGWGGVDLFFALSSYILFRNLDVRDKGQVDFARFFVSRISRIYPLMLAYAAVVILVLYLVGEAVPQLWLRFVGLALGLDNILPILAGMQTIHIPHTGHLWSLSFELQMYLLIPVLFVLQKRLGKGAFLWTLAAIVIYSTIARIVAFGLGAQHPIVYYLPIFRPESFLIGMALWVAKPMWNPRKSALAALVSWMVFFSLPQPWISQLSNVLTYPVLAVACATSLDASLRWAPLNRIMSAKSMSFLGQRGYGLYIFHVICYVASAEIVRSVLGEIDAFGPWMLNSVIAFILTLALAILSFRYFEPIFRRDWISDFQKVSQHRVARSDRAR